jgi:hypothetical protein
MKPPSNPYRKQLETIGQIQREKKESLFGFERWFSMALVCFLMIMPAMLVRWVGGRYGYLGRKIAVETFALAKPLGLLIILWCGLSRTDWAKWFSLVALADLYSYLLGLFFLGRYYTPPASYGRSLLLIGINFLESILAFSVLYLNTSSLQCGTTTVKAWSHAVYFSVVTASTVGYGDIAPVDPFGRLLSVLQILGSFVFVTVIISSFVSRHSTDRSKHRAQ